MYLWAFFIAALKFHQSNEQNRIELQISRDRIKMAENKNTEENLDFTQSLVLCIPINFSCGFGRSTRTTNYVLRKIIFATKNEKKKIDIFPWSFKFNFATTESIKIN